MTLSMWEQEKFEEGRSQGIDIGRNETLSAAEAFMKAKGLPLDLISEFKSSFPDRVWA